jgi:hypothetical protein
LCLAVTYENHVDYFFESGWGICCHAAEDHYRVLHIVAVFCVDRNARIMQKVNDIKKLQFKVCAKAYAVEG